MAPAYQLQQQGVTHGARPDGSAGSDLALSALGVSHVQDFQERFNECTRAMHEANFPGAGGKEGKAIRPHPFTEEAGGELALFLSSLSLPAPSAGVAGERRACEERTDRERGPVSQVHMYCRPSTQ